MHLSIHYCRFVHLKKRIWYWCCKCWSNKVKIDLKKTNTWIILIFMDRRHFCSELPVGGNFSWQTIILSWHFKICVFTDKIFSSLLNSNLFVLVKFNDPIPVYLDFSGAWSSLDNQHCAFYFLSQWQSYLKLLIPPLTPGLMGTTVTSRNIFESIRQEW